MISDAWAQRIAGAIVTSWQAHWIELDESPMQHIDDLRTRIATVIKEVADTVR